MQTDDQMEIIEEDTIYQFNILHHGQKLYQLFLVDRYCKMEITRLKWVKNNQTKICSNLSHSLRDCLQHRNIENTGTATHLPSSIIGSPKYLHQKCQDALSLV
jgi:DNA polymerase elongation subunit (family B)